MKTRKIKNQPPRREEIKVEVEKELIEFRARVVSILNLEGQIAYHKGMDKFAGKMDELIRSVYQIPV